MATITVSLSLSNSNKCSVDAYATQLSIVLKDHKSAEAIALSPESYKRKVREEASQQGFDINDVEVKEGEEYSCKPAHLVVTNIIDFETKSEILTALEQIKFTQLDLKGINLNEKSKSLKFFFKNCFRHNTFVMPIVYSSRQNSSRSCIVLNIIILYLCLLPDIMKVIPFWFPLPCGEPHFNQQFHISSPFQLDIFNKKDSFMAIFQLKFGEKKL